MAKEPLKDEAEVEVICPRCGYHLRRTAGRLRRDTPVVCPNCGERVVACPDSKLVRPQSAGKAAFVWQCSGVRPWRWTRSCGGFDRLPGVVMLKLRWT